MRTLKHINKKLHSLLIRVYCYRTSNT